MMIFSIVEKLLRLLHPGRALVLPILAKLRSIYFWTQYVRRLMSKGGKKVSQPENVIPTETITKNDEYDKAYSVVALNENFKYTDIPGDHGGPTKGGITQKFLDSNGIKMNVRNLTEPQRKEILYDYIWSPCKYGSLIDSRIATKVFDMNVNMGAYEAHLLLQRAIDQVSPGAVKVDGLIGPKTIAAANAVNQDELLAALRQCSVDFYDGLVDKDASQAKFLKDWLDRAWE